MFSIPTSERLYSYSTSSVSSKIYKSLCTLPILPDTDVSGSDINLDTNLRDSYPQCFTPEVENKLGLITFSDAGLNTKIHIQELLAGILNPDSNQDELRFIFDLRNACAVFKNFYNGKLLIVGNNYFYVDDLQTENKNFELTESKENTKKIIDFFNDRINNEKYNEITDKNLDLITIRGTGRNGYGSVLSINDFIGNGTIFNLNIENTLDITNIEKLSNFKFLEEPEILVEMYMNDKNNMNEIIVSNNNMVSLATPTFVGGTTETSISSATSIMVSGNFPGEIYNIDTTNSTYSRKILSGDYFYYPNLNSNLNSSIIHGWKFNGQVIPNIIYNTSPGYTYDSTSMILWAKQNQNQTLRITNPLFSLYDNDSLDNQNNPGFYVDTRRCLLV